MDIVTVDTKDLKLKYATPNEEGRLNRSWISYEYGIQGVDKFLNGKKLSDEKLEFSIYAYETHLMFLVYEYYNAVARSIIDISDLLAVNVITDADLNIKRGTEDTGVLGALSAMGIGVGIAAITIDKLSSLGKGKAKSIKGSLFELIIQNADNSIETIGVSCTSKKSSVIVDFFNKTLELSKNSKSRV